MCVCIFSLQVVRGTQECVNGHRCCSECCETLRQDAVAAETTLDYWRRRFLGPHTVTVRCPVCRVRGPFTPASHVDAELAEHPARCPYVRPSTGAQCRWVGPYSLLRAHLHRVLVERSRPRPVDAANDETD